jgi:hypothetical protein
LTAALLTIDPRQWVFGWVVWLLLLATVVVSEAADAPTPICSCGAVDRHPNDADRCTRGHVLIGNQARRTHGAYSFRDRGDRAIPVDLRTSADEMLAGIIADKGGPGNMTTLKREYAQQVRTFRVMLDLIGNHIVRNGLITPGSRVRSAVNKYLEVFDRFDKAAQRLGLEREARQVPSLQDYLAHAGAVTGGSQVTGTPTAAPPPADVQGARDALLDALAVTAMAEVEPVEARRRQTP